MIALIALGANLPFRGNSPSSNLQNIVINLAKDGIFPLSVSPIYRTPCFPVGAGPDYANAVLKAKISLQETNSQEMPSAKHIVKTTPEPTSHYDMAKALLAKFHQIESRYGRVRQNRWGGRTLDIDLLAIEGHILPDMKTYLDWYSLPADIQQQQSPKNLILPHPRIQDRPFVLVPLAKADPDWVHPVIKKTAVQMLEKYSAFELEKIYPIQT